MPTRLETLRAIVFDFDGVILESADIKTNAFLAVFASFPEKQQVILEYHLRHVGVSRYIKFEYITKNILGLPYHEKEKEKLGEAFSRITVEKILACPEVPGAHVLLPFLSTRVLRAVASGTPEEELRQIVSARKIDNWFDEVWGTPRSKPEIIRDLIDRHQLAPAEVLMVGDGMTDFKAAQETGVRFLAIEPGCVFAGVQAECVKDLNEMQNWLEENVP